MPEEIRADLLLGRDTLSPGLLKAGRAASDASSNVRQLTRDLYEAGKVRATPVVDLNDDEATAKLADVTAKLKELGAKVADPGINLDDKEAVAGLTAMRVKLDALGKKVASPRITLDGLGRAEAGIAALDLQLERLSRKHATPSVDVGGGGLLSRIGGGLGGLFGLGSGAGAAAGAGGQACGGLLAALGPTGGAIGIGAAIAAAATLIPSLLTVGLGGLLGGGAAGGAIALGAAANKQLQALGPKLATAKGAQKKALEQQMAAIRQASGGSLAVFGAFQSFGMAAKSAFSAALTGTGAPTLLPSGRPVAGTGAVSFVTSLEGIFKQLGTFVKTIGPELGDMFRASVPYLKLFVGFLEQAAKTLLPVFTQMLQQMTPFLPLISKGLMNIVDGLAGFLKAIGPSGMQASAKIFVVLTKGMAGVLVALGHTINWLTEHVPTWAHNIAAWWDRLRHETAAIFGSIGDNIMAFAHNVVSIFNALSRAAGAAWHILWDGIKQAARDGLGLVTGWFGDFPGKVVHVLLGLGTKLYNLGKTWLTDMWNGIKSVWHDVLSFFGNIPGDILHALGIHSPPDWAVSAGKDIVKGLHIGISNSFGTIGQLLGAGTGRIAGLLGFGGSTGGSAAGWITDALRLAHKPLSWLPALERLVSLESGGNPRAVNPTAVLGEHASGLWQMLPSTFAGYGGVGSIFNPVTEGIAALRYISAVYGSPFNIPGLFSGGYRGYALGGTITEPILGIGRSGRMYGFGENGPETVVPGRGAGQTIIVNVSVGHGTNPVQAAREIAEVLNAGARSGVRLRRSILSANG